jgi:hypothetical protein
MDYFNSLNVPTFGETYGLHYIRVKVAHSREETGRGGHELSIGPIDGLPPVSSS